MANLTIYSVNKLTQSDFKIFAGLYNDFKNRAINDFKFDLEPLDYEDFTKAIEDNLLQCLVLNENSIPVGFLIYTTLISFSLELNMIYLISDENYEAKVRQLMNDFINREKDLLNEKIVTYPLLGDQEKYKDVLSEFDFKNISQSVLKFDFSNPTCISKLNLTKELKISDDFEITNWEDFYFDAAVKVIHNNFKHTNDALFDPRFKSFKGVEDIISKITTSCYGKFLPQYTKIAHKDNNIIGICFVNVTGDSLVNIPLVSVNKNFRGQNIAKKMISLATQEIFEDTLNGVVDFSEINVTTDTFNVPAMKMYEYCGFKEEYSYSQSYKEP